MPASIETELRAVLSNQEASRLRAYCAKNGQLTSTERRMIIDYSSFIEGVRNRTQDIRVRVTNGSPEIVVKIGALADHSRLESNVLVRSSVHELVELMGLLGYNKGVLVLKTIERYTLGTIEVSIVANHYVSNPSKIHSYLLEVEICHEDTEKARQDAVYSIKQLLNKLDIEPIDDTAFYEWIEDLNTEANDIFEYQKTDLRKYHEFIT